MRTERRLMQTSWSIEKQECAVNIEQCTQEPSANDLALVKQYFLTNQPFSQVTQSNFAS